MPVIPAWLITAFWQYGAPLLIAVLRQMGAVGWAESLAAKLAVWIKNNIKTYQDEPYPSGVNGQRDQPPVSIQEWKDRGNPP